MCLFTNKRRWILCLAITLCLHMPSIYTKIARKKNKPPLYFGQAEEGSYHRWPKGRFPKAAGLQVNDESRLVLIQLAGRVSGVAWVLCFHLTTFTNGSVNVILLSHQCCTYTFRFNLFLHNPTITMFANSSSGTICSFHAKWRIGLKEWSRGNCLLLS